MPPLPLKSTDLGDLTNDPTVGPCGLPFWAVSGSWGAMGEDVDGSSDDLLELGVVGFDGEGFTLCHGLKGHDGRFFFGLSVMFFFVFFFWFNSNVIFVAGNVSSIVCWFVVFGHGLSTALPLKSSAKWCFCPPLQWTSVRLKYEQVSGW